jgi:hydroxymethylpyrimidine pyrophosphatase-like HAD family hydrolase
MNAPGGEAMRYLALVTDYDGTIAIDGKMADAAVTSIERLRMSGRRAILVTGRRLEDLLAILPHVHLFDYVVAENGAVVYEPRTRRETLLANPLPLEFIERLKALGIPLEVGRVVVATWMPHHNAVLQAIQETGLELHVIFNRAAVLV